jgi:acetyltransferase-like isoleucine patch superfamily enzyme
MGAVLTTHTRSRTTLSVGRIDVGDDVIIGGMALVREGIRIGAGAEIDATLHLTRNVRPGEKLVAPRNGTSVRAPE